MKYEGIPSLDCNIAKTLELQQWILDPSSRPYDIEDRRLIARSAGANTETKERDKSLVQKQLELQKMILGD